MLVSVASIMRPNDPKNMTELNFENSEDLFGKWQNSGFAKVDGSIEPEMNRADKDATLTYGLNFQAREQSTYSYDKDMIKQGVCIQFQNTQHYSLTFRIKVIGFDEDDEDNNPTFVVRLAKNVNEGGTNSTSTATTEKPSNATAAPSTNGTTQETAEARAEDEPEWKTMKIFDISQYGSTFEDATEFNDVT